MTDIYALLALETLILTLLCMVHFKPDTLIGWLGGYTYQKHINIVTQETRAMKIDCLHNEWNRLTYLKKKSNEGRMVNIIANEHKNVTTQLLRMEQ